MKAMILKQLCDLNQDRSLLELVEFPYPSCKEDEVVVEVATCGVCRTELDEIEGRTPPSFFPMILGHEIVGRVVEKGSHVQKIKIGDRVGIAWIYSSCGKCSFCHEEGRISVPNQSDWKRCLWWLCRIHRGKREFCFSHSF